MLVTFVLASVGTEQPLPPSLVAPLVAAGAALALLLALGWLASRPGAAPALSRRALPLGAALFAAWVAGTLAVAVHLRSAEGALRARQASFAALAARSTAGLDALASPVAGCVDRLEVGGATTLAGYLVAPARVSALREKLPRADYFPRLLVPGGAGMITLSSVGVPLRPAPPFLDHLRRAAAAAPWDWPALWRAGPANDLSDVHYFVVASLRSFDARTSRLDLAVRVLPAAGGDPVCEGTYSALVPPGAGADFPLASALEASAFTAVCRAGSQAFCGHVRRFAPLVPDAPPAPAPGPAPSPVPAPADGAGPR